MKLDTTHNLLVIIMLTASLAFWSCISPDPESTLLQAENDLQYGDVDSAVSSCELLCDSTNTSLSPTQLCRVALLYAKISEKVEDSDYMAAAAKCFDRAIGMSNDSIESYIESLNIEDQSYVRVIREVSRTLNTPVDMTREFEDEEYSDSIMSDDGSVAMSIRLTSKYTASL